jgi:RNA methyltransferase, TrmH family
MQEIKSLKNEIIQLARNLNTKKGRIQSNKYLIEGFEAIDWALQAGVDIDFILLSSNLELPKMIPVSIDVFQISEGLIKKVTDTKYLIPIVAVGNRKKSGGTPHFQVVLDGLHDFGNIGTIVRTCNAFGIDSIISTKNDFDLFHRKTVDASRGKAFATDYRCFASPESTVKYLKENNYQIVTTSPYGDRIQSLANLSDKPVALIVGNETTGVSEVFMQHADLVVQIPMHSEVESLNVSVATGISIYELRLKQVLGMIENKIKSTLGREVNVAGMLIQQALDEKLKKTSDFSSKQIVFMMVLKCDAIMKVADIQKQFGIPNVMLSCFLEPLTEKNLIVSDGQNNLSITEKGIETIGKLWAIIENTENQILKGFSEQEKAIFNEMLQRVKTNCIDIIDG